MSIGKEINNFFEARTNLIKEALEDANTLQIKVAELEAVSGFNIDILIELFKKGYELKEGD